MTIKEWAYYVAQAADGDGVAMLAGEVGKSREWLAAWLRGEEEADARELSRIMAALRGKKYRAPFRQRGPKLAPRQTMMIPPR